MLRRLERRNNQLLEFHGGDCYVSVLVIFDNMFSYSMTLFKPYMLSIRGQLINIPSTINTLLRANIGSRASIHEEH